jgi:hypothetical protein
MKPTPRNPKIIIAQVPGSGTAEMFVISNEFVEEARLNPVKLVPVKVK